MYIESLNLNYKLEIYV